LTPYKAVEYQEVPDLIGLMLASGSAAQIQPLPYNKCAFLIAFLKTDSASKPRAKSLSEFHLEQMHRACIRKAYVVFRKGKRDIPFHPEDRYSFGMDMAYLMRLLKIRTYCRFYDL
jgi:hypothetical protein